MGNNIIIDVSEIDTALSQMNQLWHEGRDRKFWINGSWCAPLHLDQSMRDFRIEASVIGGNLQGWQGFNTNSITYDYYFNNQFSYDPVINITYDGTADAVSSKIIYNSSNSKDRVTIKLTKTTSNSKWTAGEPFVVHLIAIGN